MKFSFFYTHNMHRHNFLPLLLLFIPPFLFFPKSSKGKEVHSQKQKSKVNEAIEDENNKECKIEFVQRKRSKQSGHPAELKTEDESKPSGASSSSTTNESFPRASNKMLDSRKMVKAKHPNKENNAN